MIIGFTGTQEGMSPRQKNTLYTLLWNMNDWHRNWLHHGDCIGADAEAHDIASAAGYKIAIHPPRIPDKRAYKTGEATRPEKDYLERNKNIVDECHILIAAPFRMQEELRSGTWSTVRYANKTGRELIILAR